PLQQKLLHQALLQRELLQREPLQQVPPQRAFLPEGLGPGAPVQPFYAPPISNRMRVKTDTGLPGRVNRQPPSERPPATDYPLHFDAPGQAGDTTANNR